VKEALLSLSGVLEGFEPEEHAQSDSDEDSCQQISCEIPHLYPDVHLPSPEII
jgi:hypothetical protein